MTTAVPKRRLATREYLEHEREGQTRSEYSRGELISMASEGHAHTQIKDNLAAGAKVQLKGGPCRVITRNMRVRVAETDFYAYPDVIFISGEATFEDSHCDTLLNPRAIVEVLSGSTEQFDRGKKFAHYREIPSLQEYVLISQDRPLIERYVRQPDETWVLRIFNDMSQAFEFASITATIPLSEIYRDVMFEKRAAAEG
jgi:Uma2 family endonuclease